MLDELVKRPIIPVIVIDDAESAVPLAEALLAGGIDVIEVTMRTAAAAGAIARIGKSLPEMLLGAGTVLTTDQADQAIDAGATFALAPGLNPQVVKHVQSRDTLFIPGVITPSEIEQGLALGCKMLKFFPAANAGGPTALRVMAEPYANQDLRFCPTGGVNPNNINDYLSLPMVSCVGGSWLAKRQQIAAAEWAAITRQAKEALASVA